MQKSPSNTLKRHNYAPKSPTAPTHTPRSPANTAKSATCSKEPYIHSKEPYMHSTKHSHAPEEP